MADARKKTDGPSPFTDASYDFTLLPDFNNDFVDEDDIIEFARALAAPENSPSTEDLTALTPTQPSFITALNDWRPVHQRVRRRKKRRQPPRRGKDETREGFVYTLLKWPLLITVFGWLAFLGVSYVFTRLYIYLYEHWVTWRGKREELRKSLQGARSYEDWITGARELDTYLGNDAWKKKDEYAYYDSRTIRRVRDQMAVLRHKVEVEEMGLGSLNGSPRPGQRPIDELRALAEACVKNNFVGFENPRLYSETYYGTKDVVQSFVDEVTASLELLDRSAQLSQESKYTLFKHIHANFGRTALCLSGGATFAYYHFGVAKALLDASLLPSVITGTSGGALVAAMLCTRTDEELKQLLVPALAYRITACHDAVVTWIARWWKTGARFDSIDWAARCAWFCRGSMTFREAYDRTGRILNVSCVPSDPHSPTILANYITSPDCVIWSAVLASAAVPGILNPVVLMKKTKAGTLVPYSFGHKWKDGSLRTDIPLKALNLHFNVRFPVVSQVNPHINLFFFSSRGSVGHPVTHRKGRGWRGGFLGSATEQYLKLDLTKWLKVLRHLELLPRPLGQDWSEIWLQRFSGTITIWPKSVPSDYYNILSDPSSSRLGRMIHVGQQSAFPKLKFIANRTKLERAIARGRRNNRPARGPEESADLQAVLSEDDLRGLLKEAQQNNGVVHSPLALSAAEESSSSRDSGVNLANKPRPRLILKAAKRPSEKESKKPQKPTTGDQSPSLSRRFTGWLTSISSPRSSRRPKDGPYGNTDTAASKDSPAPYAGGISHSRPASMFEFSRAAPPPFSPRDRSTERLWRQAADAQGRKRESWVEEIDRQSQVFFDDDSLDDEEDERGRLQRPKGGDRGRDSDWEGEDGADVEGGSGEMWTERVGEEGAASSESEDESVVIDDGEKFVTKE